MRNQGQMFLGAVILLLGALFLIGNVFNIDIGDFCWPIGLILLGVFLIVRPRMVQEGTAVTQKFLGDIRRDGVWDVEDEEIWGLIVDLEYDLLQADVPSGETRLRFVGFIGDLELVVPPDVGVAVSSTAVVSEVKMPAAKEENFLTPLRLQTENYKTAERRIHLETTSFISEVKIRQVGITKA